MEEETDGRTQTAGSCGMLLKPQSKQQICENFRQTETTNFEQSRAVEKAGKSDRNSYLPDEGLHRDHVGGGPRTRLGHCTSAGLTPAIIPNVDNSVV